MGMASFKGIKIYKVMFDTFYKKNAQGLAAGTHQI